jgi:hypothetical protein
MVFDRHSRIVIAPDYPARRDIDGTLIVSHCVKGSKAVGHIAGNDLFLASQALESVVIGIHFGDGLDDGYIPK